MSSANLASRSDEFRRVAWIAFLVTAGALFSFSFACATPFAALAALAALRMARRDAAAVVAASWLANQAIGFCVLSYPHDALTVAWGAVIGIAALVSLLGAGSVAARLDRSPDFARSAAAFLAAFAAYEAALYGATFVLGGAEAAFAWPVVREIFLIDAVSFVGLLAAFRAALAIGLVARPSPRLPAPA